ncbi:MAG: hypothetical protein ACOC3X_03875 [Nanoarchaeota archaeon]
MILNLPKPNINKKETIFRGLIGLIFFIITIFVLLYNLNPIILFISIFMSLIGFIQYFLKFCVLVAFTKIKKKNDEKRQALKIISFSIILSLILTYILIL